jgi:hypothetical protein
MGMTEGRIQERFRSCKEERKTGTALFVREEKV